MLNKIVDECAEQSLRTIAALRATTKAFYRGATDILFRHQFINGHETSASSHIPSKFRLFFVSNPRLCCFPTCLEFHGGEFHVEKVEAIIRLLPNVNKLTLDHCTFTHSPTMPIMDPLPQIRRAIFFASCVNSGALNDLFIVFERLEAIHFSLCSFEGIVQAVLFPKSTSELLLDLGGDLGEAIELVEMWAQNSPLIRSLEFRCHTNGIVGRVMPWAMACASTLENLKIAMRGCFLSFIFVAPRLNFRVLSLR